MTIMCSKQKCVAWDLVFYFIVVSLGIIGLIVLVTGVFPNLLIMSEEATCRSRLSSYCSILLCGSTPNFNLEGCEKYVGTKTPTREDCERFGFKCR